MILAVPSPCILARGAFEKLAPVYPSVFPGRWLDELRGSLLRNSLSLSLVSPWQIFNSTATWKNRILPMLAATRPAIPHRGGGMCVWALEAASIHTLLGNLISTKKLIWCISLISRSRLWKGSEWHTLLSLLSLYSIPIFDIFRWTMLPFDHHSIPDELLRFSCTHAIFNFYCYSYTSFFFFFF